MIQEIKNLFDLRMYQLALEGEKYPVYPSKTDDELECRILLIRHQMITCIKKEIDRAFENEYT